MRADQQRAERGHPGVGERVEAHHPPAERVRGGELERGVAAGREEDLAAAERDQQQRGGAEVPHQRRGHAVPALSTVAETARNRSEGRPRRSRVSPIPAITAPAPSDDMSRPNPCAPSPSTSFATSGTTTLKLSTRMLTATIRVSVNATGGVRAA